jgi:hypothetical protein
MVTRSRPLGLLPLGTLAALLGLACASTDDAAVDGYADAPPGPSFGSADVRLSAMVESTVSRWNAAACLGIVASDAPDHRLVFDDGSSMTGGRLAQTNGSMVDATIRILDDEVVPWHYTPEALERLVMHEMAHLLAFTNEHVADGALGPGKGDNTITQATLTRVCSSENPSIECRCFNVEP